MEEVKTWLEQRRAGIGGSDAGPICGLRSFGKSQLTVFADKTIGKTPDAPSEEMDTGNELEPFLFAKVEKKLNCKLVPNGKKVHKSSKFPWMLATPDALDHRGNVGYEVKAVGNWMRNLFGPNEIPDVYTIQCHHYMIVFGLERWVLGAFFGGELRLQPYEIERDPVLVDMIIELEHKFWHEYVLEKQEPPEEDPKIVSEYLGRKFPKVIEELLPVQPDTQLMSEILAYRDARANAAYWDGVAKKHANDLKTVIGSAAGLDLGDKNSIKWFDVKRTDWKAVAEELCKTLNVTGKQLIEKYTTQSRTMKPFGKMFKVDSEDGRE